MLKTNSYNHSKASGFTATDEFYTEYRTKLKAKLYTEYRTKVRLKLSYTQSIGLRLA